MEGRRGLELARDHRRVDVPDLHLPDLPGTEVLADLCADPRTREIPVVGLSVDATPNRVDRLLALGARSLSDEAVGREGVPRGARWSADLTVPRT